MAADRAERGSSTKTTHGDASHAAARVYHPRALAARGATLVLQAFNEVLESVPASQLIPLAGPTHGGIPRGTACEDSTPRAVVRLHVRGRSATVQGSQPPCWGRAARRDCLQGRDHERAWSYDV